MGVRESDININSPRWRNNALRTKGITFKLNKIDKVTGQPVANAIIALEKEIAPESHTFTFCAKKTTNIAGVVEFKSLSRGRYRIREQQDTGAALRQRFIVEPSDGMNDDTYYYFNVDDRKGNKNGEMSVVAYNDPNELIEASLLEQRQRNTRFVISSDPQGVYLFAPDQLLISDGEVNTGNYYAEALTNGTWQFTEDAHDFVPTGQLSLHDLPIGTYFMRPFNASVHELALRFHVTERTRAVFLDYTHQKTYEMLKLNETDSSITTLSDRYKKGKKRKRRKKIVMLGTLVVGLSVLGAGLKRTLED